MFTIFYLSMYVFHFSLYIYAKKQLSTVTVKEVEIKFTENCLPAHDSEM